MAAPAFDVHCPACRARLTISPEARAVVGHKPAEAPKPVEDLGQAVNALKKEPGRREGLFKDSLSSEQQKAERLKKSFDDLLKRAQDDPDAPRPVRDMDLD